MMISRKFSTLLSFCLVFILTYKILNTQKDELPKWRKNESFYAVANVVVLNAKLDFWTNSVYFLPLTMTRNFQISQKFALGCQIFLRNYTNSRKSRNKVSFLNFFSVCFCFDTKRALTRTRWVFENVNTNKLSFEKKWLKNDFWNQKRDFCKLFLAKSELFSRKNVVFQEDIFQVQVPFRRFRR